MSLIDSNNLLPRLWDYISDPDYEKVQKVISELPSAEKTGKWIVRTRHEHFPSGKEYTELVCPFCGRTDHNGDGCYCGYCGAKMEREKDK